MKRRKFLVLACFSAMSSVTTAWAQPAPVPIVGFLAPRPPSASLHLPAAFRRGLRDAGFIDGGSVTVDIRGDDRVDRMPEIAAELVRRKVDVLAAFSTVAARAAKSATSTIPVVFVTGDDPVAAGIVTSFNRPVGNVTGVTFSSAILGTKRFELLRALVPSVGLIGVMFDPKSPESLAGSRDAQTVAATLSQQLLVLGAGTEAEVEAAFNEMALRRVGAVLVSGSPFYNSRMAMISALALRHSLPSMNANREQVVAGGLVSYGASIPNAYHQAGTYVGRVLKGAKTSELPVIQPVQFELVLNLKTAKALGLAVPDKMMALADEVIE